MFLTPLELPGWVEFNTWRTGLKALAFAHAPSPGGPEIRAILYLDRRGRVRCPINNPFLPVAFFSPRHSPSGRTADWLAVAAPLVDEMKRRGVPAPVKVPPAIDDVRPWGWRGFRIGVGYAYLVDLPFDPGLLDRDVARVIRKATRLGMTVERVRDVDLVADCLTAVETRKNFSRWLGPRELRAADDLLGPDNLRMYACLDRDGQAAGAYIVVHAPGTRAVAWQAGTKTAFLPSGAGHLLQRHVLDDLSAAGAIGVDFGATDDRQLARFKASWGFRLTPTFNVRSYSVRAAARFVKDWIHSGDETDTAF